MITFLANNNGIHNNAVLQDYCTHCKKVINLFTRYIVGVSLLIGVVLLCCDELQELTFLRLFFVL